MITSQVVSLGQGTDSPEPIPFPDFDMSQILEEQYFKLKEKCIEQYGADFCNAVMPRSMVYAITRRDEGYTVPWWFWMIVGAVAGKLIR